MTLGDASAKSKRTALTTGYKGSSRIAWGYAMVTPYMTIRISDSGNNYDVNVDGIGSCIKKSGENTLEWR